MSPASAVEIGLRSECASSVVALMTRTSSCVGRHRRVPPVMSSSTGSPTMACSVINGWFAPSPSELAAWAPANAWRRVLRSLPRLVGFDRNGA